jgi:glycosyltransferase involved in cell wall biosynthesis
VKFLFTLHNFFPEPVFGAERVCIQQMAALLQMGHEVALFYAGNHPVSRRTLRENGLGDLTLFPVRYIPSRAQPFLSIRNLRVSRNFRRCLRRWKPEVAVYHHLVRLSLDLPRIGGNHGVPGIYYLHDFYLLCPSYSLTDSDGEICGPKNATACPACMAGKRFSGLPRPLRRGFNSVFSPLMRAREKKVRRILSEIDLFVSPSRFLLSRFRENGVEFRRCRVISNGAPKPSSIPKEKKGRGIRFGFLGNVIPKKGIDVLVDALRGGLDRFLTIRGFAGHAEIHRFRSANPGFEARLEIFHSDAASFWREIDVLIVPSIWPENQPLVVLEAFAHRVPVICSRIGGLPEMVRHGRWGFCFEAGNSAQLREYCSFLIENPEVVSKMAQEIPTWPSPEENAEELLAAARCLGRDSLR